MATNNHALIRYMTIDRCLKGSGTYHLKDLIRECSASISRYEQQKKPAQMSEDRTVSRRTILYDLDFMKDDQLGFGAPIRSDRIDGYYYEDRRFEIFRARIAPSDLEELNQSLLILKRISGSNDFKDLQSVITRLEETYNIRRSHNSKPVIYFENSSNIEGQKWINDLKHHIQQQETISIHYEPFGRAAYYRIISPYIIKEYNNRWFLIGFDHDASAMTTLGLDRIRILQASLRPYHHDPDFDPDKYLQDIIGISISPDLKKQKIVFKALGNQQHYIRTKPLHASQNQEESTAADAIFSIEVIPNYELESKLLGFGDQVEVLEPAWLREKIKGRAVELLKRYG